MRSRIVKWVAALIALAVAQTSQAWPTPLSTSFTYQGQLKLSGAPVNSSADFQFTLWDALSGPTQVAGPLAVNNVAVTDGLFTTAIDFGANTFNVNARWLEIAVRSPAGSGAFTTLTPRQPLTPVPLALQTRGLTYYNGNIGMGIDFPVYRLAIQSNNENTLALIGPGAYGSMATLKFGEGLANIQNDDIDSLTVYAFNHVKLSAPFPIGSEGITLNGDAELGTNSADYRHLRVGGGNASGFLYGSFPYFGDGIHIGYNFYADAAGNGHVVNGGGGTSRVSMGYGYVSLATNSAAQNAIDRLYINSTGSIGIGTSSPGFLLHCNGTAGKPGGGSWSVASDLRLKKNIAPLQDALDSLLSLRGVTFQYIDPQAIKELPGQRIGMIAQGVEKIFPDWVEEGADGFKTVTYRGFEALTVEALRDLRAEKDAQLDKQQRQLDSLQSENDALHKELKTLENQVRLLTEQQQRGAK